MRSPCALLIAAFLITGCGVRKVQPVIVRETVTLRGQRGAAPQPDARQATTLSRQERGASGRFAFLASQSFRTTQWRVSRNNPTAAQISIAVLNRSV